MTGFLEDIKQIPFDQIQDLCDKYANERWQIWKEFFLDCLNKHAPVINIKVKGNALPYVTYEIRSLIKTRDHLKSKAVKTGSNYIQQAFCQVRSRAFSLLKKSRQDNYIRRIEENKGDVKNTWKILKQVIKAEEQSSVIEKISYNGEEISGKFKFREVTLLEVISVLKKLLNGKAAGTDGITNRALKDSAELITPSSTDVFNFSISTKTYPDDFKIAEVPPVFNRR